MLKRICLIGVASLLMAGCGGSSSKSPQSGTQTISLTRAAFVSTQSPGNKVLMSMRENIPGVGRLTMTGNGTFSSASREGAMTMQMSIPSAAAAQSGLSNLRIQAVVVPGTIYMKLPPQITAKLPGGKPWWKIDLRQASKLAGIPGLSSLLSSSSSFNNPGQYLDFLRATSQGSIKNLGPATVDGVQTTHYHAEADLAKLPSAVPASARPGVEQLIAALQKRGAAPNGLPVDAWIDSSSLIRRVELIYSQPLGSGQSANVDMKVDYVDYGPQPAPKLPAPGETVDLLSLLGQG